MSALQFELPHRLEANEPPEARGLARDEVRLMVASKHDGQIAHARFKDLPAFLAAGDLIVVNTSATLPAALPARRSDGLEVELHFSTPVPHRVADRWWIVELRANDRPFLSAREGDELTLPGGGRAEIVAPQAGGRRLWVAKLDLPEPKKPDTHTPMPSCGFLGVSQ